MRGGITNVMIEAPIINQLRNDTCCALPTWFEEINSTSCVGITIGNSAADCALRANHSTFRTSCPPIESRETFTSPPHSFDDIRTLSFTHSFSFEEYITTSPANLPLKLMLQYQQVTHITAYA